MERGTSKRETPTAPAEQLRTPLSVVGVSADSVSSGFNDAHRKANTLNGFEAKFLPALSFLDGVASGLSENLTSQIVTAASNANAVNERFAGMGADVKTAVDYYREKVRDSDWNGFEGDVGR